MVLFVKLTALLPRYSYKSHFYLLLLFTFFKSTLHLDWEIICGVINGNVVAKLLRNRTLIWNTQTGSGSPSESLQRRDAWVIISTIIIASLI